MRVQNSATLAPGVVNQMEKQFFLVVIQQFIALLNWQGTALHNLELISGLDRLLTRLRCLIDSEAIIFCHLAAKLVRLHFSG